MTRSTGIVRIDGGRAAAWSASVWVNTPKRPLLVEHRDSRDLVLFERALNLDQQRVGTNGDEVGAHEVPNGCGPLRFHRTPSISPLILGAEPERAATFDPPRTCLGGNS